MNNRELKQLYEKVYAEGKENFFTFNTRDVSEEVLKELDWKDKNVLEVGCGTGETAYLLAVAGARVLAMDFASSAINEAVKKHQHPSLKLQVGSFEDIEGYYDVVVIQEVIEHLDDPMRTLIKLKEHLEKDGHLIVTCPSFANLRGHVWMTLQLLLNIPMSLSDRHFISPFDMENWAKEMDMDCKWHTFRYGQSHGKDMLKDMKKRLTNALKDAELDNSRVDALIDWLDHVRKYEEDGKHNGAKGLYHFTFQH